MSAPADRLAWTKTALDGLLVVRRHRLTDVRGFLSRVFCADELSAAGWSWPVAQINHTLTHAKGSLRGLHYQAPPHAEAKLVTCVRGEVFDVAVDVRNGSPTFLQWHGEILSAANATSLLIPPGFAHGFQTLTAECEMLYLHSTPHAPGAERGLDALDRALRIDWPLPVGERSNRDSSHPPISPQFLGVHR